MVKKYMFLKGFTLLLLALMSQLGYAQNVGINSTGAAPHTSAGLDVDFTNKGFLAPRLTLAQKTTLSATATAGLLIYQTDGTAGFYYYTGTTWLYLGQTWTPLSNHLYYNAGNIGIGSSSTPGYALTVGAATNPLFLSGVQEGSGLDSILLIVNGVVKKRVFSASASTNAWSLTGNATQTSTHNSGSYIGTSDANALRFRTSNTQRMHIDASGNVAIGTNPSFSASAEKLLVDAGTTTSYNLISAKGSYNNYLQMNIQNTSAGTSASSDIVASNSLATEANDNYYIDMGINSNAYTLNTNPILNGFSTAYLFNKGGDLAIGSATSGKYIKFFTNGTALTDEKMRITSTGAIGFGSSASTGTSGYVLTSSGSGASPTWAELTSWNRTGNSNIDSTSNFIGTTNSQAMVFRTNNTEKMRINPTGQVIVGGIANQTADKTNGEKFIVDGGTTMNEVLGVYGTVNGYVQLGVKNLSSGNDASSDIVATADNGSETSNYIDMGINSSSYTNNKSNILNKINVAYLYSNANASLKIGNGGLGQRLVFFTNPIGGDGLGTLTANGVERMKIDGDGNVGIGTFVHNNGSDESIDFKLTVDGIVAPRSSNSYTLGTSNNKWSVVYAQNTTINASDRRLKKNIIDLNYGLKEILSLQPVRYNWKDPKDPSNKIGLIAQDTRKIIPEVVYGDESKEDLGMGYSELVPVLINAIKEQQKQIDELKQQVQKLQK